MGEAGYATRPWTTPGTRVERIDPDIVERLASKHEPYPKAVAMDVDIQGGPHAQDNDGHNWSVLSRARNVADMVPGSEVIMGSIIGDYLAKVVAWDFEVSDEDPMVIMDLLSVTPKSVADALARTGSPAA